jgi:site-specific DNA-methyltransferase (adenine-specific)
VKPYYDDGTVTIYHGDAREIAPMIVADVVITDPPYGIGLVAKTTGSTLPVASTLYRDDPEHVRELIVHVVVPLIERVGRALIFPGPNMMFAYPEPRAVGCAYMPRGTGRSAWGFQLSHPIFYYGKDPYLQDGRGGRPNGFWDTPIRGEVDGHPCPKPIKWMRWAVERASRPGEIVLDPFVGSGTTIVAARERGRRVIGIEIEERYCEIAAQRCAQDVLDFAA